MFIQLKMILEMNILERILNYDKQIRKSINQHQIENLNMILLQMSDIVRILF
jgi:tryptophanyl-tRNA synthetase